MSFDSYSEAAYSELFDRLWPICRSIAGPGVDESYALLARHLPLKLDEVASGTAVFDWVVPPAWTIRSARLFGPGGETVVDMKDHNLHVVSYSEPVDREFTLDELQPHLYSLPDQPDRIPYVTSPYKRRFGFCLPHRQRESLAPGTYRAVIDSTIEDDAVRFAATELAGDTDELVLLSSYLCHPSLANNELSGPLVLLGLHERIRAWERRRKTYRFLLNPETIGSLCYLSKHGPGLKARLDYGLVLTCVGGPDTSLSYKRSRPGDSLLDRLIEHLQRVEPERWRVREFDPTSGSDERQYGSPGFKLPMGQMARSVYGDYPEYHTSGDTKQLMDVAQIVRTVDQLESLLLLAEDCGIYLNQQPYGEPQLGPRGLYPDINTPNLWDDLGLDARRTLDRIRYLLNYADGEHDLIAIAERAGCSVRDLVPVAGMLERHELLKREAPIQF